LVRRPDENTAGPVLFFYHIGGRDERQDLILQHLPVPSMIFIPDHKIHDESFLSPESMRLDHLFNELNVGVILNL
jgi:hypothetical protein